MRILRQDSLGYDEPQPGERKQSVVHGATSEHSPLHAACKRSFSTQQDVLSPICNLFRLPRHRLPAAEYVPHRRALTHRARQLNALQERSWGDVAAYSPDPDARVLAFARRLGRS